MARKLDTEPQGRVTAVARRLRRRPHLQGCPGQRTFHPYVPRRRQVDGRTQPKLAKPSSWTCRRRRTLRPGRPRSMLQPSSQHRITSKPRRKDRGGHHLQLPHWGLQVRPKQRLQEGNGAETPPLPCPVNWTKGFPRCSKRGRKKKPSSHLKKTELL